MESEYMNLKNILLGGLALALTISVLTRPGRQQVIPTIVTRYDTVSMTEFVHDTQWVTKLKHDTVYKVNIVEKVITTPPETLRVFYTTSGVTALRVGEKFGDTTKVLSFTLAPKDSSPPRFLLTRYQYNYFTPGPLASLALSPEGKPVVGFYDPPPVCNLSCRAKYTGAGAAIAIIAHYIFGGK
jgi:hypothetical protein